MKRRLIAVLLVLSVLSMCTLFTSCARENVYGAVAKALENTKDMDSMDAKMKMEMEMEMLGQTIDMTIIADVKAKELSSDDPIMYTKLALSAMGETQVAEAYQEGDWMYISVDGMEYKTNVKEDMETYSYTDDVDSMMADIPEEFMDDLEFEIGKDGSKTVTISIPDEEFAEIFGDYLNNMNSSTGLEGGEVTISDAEIVITVLDNYISEYEMEFTMTMDMSGVAVEAEVKASLEFEDPSEEVEITPPEGYQDFEEMDSVA